MPYVDPRAEFDSVVAPDGQTEGHVAQRVLNEFVKSYGARYDETTNDWSWSTDNIRTAFKENPIWTTIDYATLLVPVGRLGLAARAVSKGQGAAGAAYKAFEAGTKIAELETAPTRLGARMLGAFKGSEYGRAVELELRAPGRSRFARAFESPVTGLRRGADDDYISLIKQGYGSEADRRGMALMYDRERKAELEFTKLQSAEVGNALKGLSDEQGTGVVRALQSGGLRPAEGIDQAWGAGSAAQRRLGRELPGAAPMSASMRRQAELREMRLGKTLGGTLERGAGGAITGVTGVDAKATAAYAKTWAFRESVHRRAFDLGLISRDTYARNLAKYAPKLYEEFLAAEEVAGTARKGGVAAGTLDSFKARTLPRAEDALSRRATKLRNRATELRAEAETGVRPKRAKAAGPAGIVTEHVPAAREKLLARAERMDAQADRLLAKKAGVRDNYTDVLDPKATMGRLMGTAQAIAKQEYAQKLAKSVVAQDAWPVLERAAAAGHARAAAMVAAKDAGGRVSRESLDDVLEGELGWRKLRSFFPGRELPGYLKRLEGTGLLDRYLDPAAAETIASTFKFADKPVFQELHDAMYKSLAFFRSSKTIMNPATHSRNTLSGIVFNSMATGVPKLFPRIGLKSIRAKDEVWKDAVRAGVIGNNDHAITMEMLEKSGVNWNDANPYKLKLLGDSRVGKFVAAAHDKGAALYRMEDDMWKLDAFHTIRGRYMKAGFRRDQANARAALEVAKFMPSFNQVSPFTQMIGQWVPFASFTNEAVRIWKNAMIEKPHLASFWSHFGGSMSQTVGAVQGYSQDELSQIDANLPSHQQGKPRLMLPFKINDQPHFFDLSYIIPLAGNMGEIQHADKAFFFSEFYDITGNPLIGAGVVAATGVDPFTGKEVEPRFLERQGGVNIDNPAARRYVGLAEWMAATMAPPLAPPGFGAANLLELARGQKDPTTGLELEPSIARTVSSNILGLRTYEATLSSNILNQRIAQDRVNKRVEVQWGIWKRAMADGDTEAQEEAIANIRDARAKLEDDPRKADDYIAKGIKERMPGEFRTLTRKQRRALLDGIEGLELSPEQLKLRGAIMGLEQESRSRRRGSRRGSSRGKRRE